MIHAIKTNAEYKTYHDGAHQKLRINLAPYIKDGNQLGFGLSVNQTVGDAKTVFLLGLTFGEAVVVSKWFENALIHIFDAQYSADIAQAKEYAAKRDSLRGSQISQEEPQKKEAEVEDNNSDLDDIF